MISQTAEYALRAIVFLADHAETAKTAEAIAKETKVPVGYLAKIMHSLAKAGLVTSQRGIYGGFTLNRDPKVLSMYDVVHAVDPINRITECPLDVVGHGTALCPLHRGLDNAVAAVEMAFRKMTIHQVLNQPNGNRPLCPFPREKVVG